MNGILQRPDPSENFRDLRLDSENSQHLSIELPTLCWAKSNPRELLWTLTIDHMYVGQSHQISGGYFWKGEKNQII